MEYFFVLGRQPEISLAEIFSWFRKNKIEFEARLCLKSVLRISVPKKIDALFLMRELGGTIKIALAQPTSSDWETAALDLIKNKFSARGGQNHKQKIYFGISCYGKERRTLYQSKLGAGQAKNKEQVGMRIKKILKEEGWAVRFVTSRESALSSVVVKTNKLLSDRGIEIIIVDSPDGFWLTQTLAVQPFAELSERDYGRPGRDARSGMLPPKLAKIMINLAEVGLVAVILDPFCGSGTILTEAALMGYKNLIGNDINQKAVEDTKKNVKWQTNRFQISDFRFQIFREDAKRISSRLPPHSIEAIITEPYLGPPLKGNETEKQIEKIKKELSELYLKSLQEFKKILKPGGKIVMIWPVFQKNTFLPLENEIKKMGFQIEPLLPALFASLLTPRGTLIYARPEQKVGREIVRLNLK